MPLSNLFQNNQKWIDGKLAGDPEYFKRLSKGQHPKVLYIGCSDSRVTAEELMGVNPGEVFVHRNIANMVPNTDLSAMSVINYAVKHLEVEHIVVCGHYECGGVQAAMKPADLGILNPWLRGIRDVFRLHKAELDLIADDSERFRRLVELNVQEQCINVMKTADVQTAYRDGRLLLHGWVFDIESGTLRDLKIDFPKILDEIREVYQLD